MTDFEQDLNSIAGKQIAFVGKLGSMTRREAFRLLRASDAVPRESLRNVDIVVVGADQIPLDNDSLLSEDVRNAADRGELEVINETELWNRLGLVESQNSIRRLYTPAMLAQLLDLPVRVIRRWHHRGLIVPSREVHRLPYFDFQEVATARRLAELLAAGASPKSIEKKLEQLAKLVPGVDRPLAQLSVIIEGRQLLLRQGEGLIEPDGQMLLDFDASGAEDAQEGAAEPPSVLKIDQILEENELPRDSEQLTTEQIVEMAVNFEDEGQYDDAIEMYRAALMSGGIDAALCFRLAELLYLTEDLSAARERYSITIELDPDYVEARAGLGCLLKELGDQELAVAAFRGAIKHHPDYPDAHYHLAQTLTQLDQHEEADEHWRIFLSLTPDSPWAEEARHHLGIEVESNTKEELQEEPYPSHSFSDLPSHHLSHLEGNADGEQAESDSTPRVSESIKPFRDS